ncbi:ABC transporter ATP-binding protein [Curvivirga sp.]|uniref:ABC transporter ATP-binding protein n=1 Tax=Curvivirga sp. TaxID=2856848 RepID=UPI003B5C6565
MTMTGNNQSTVIQLDNVTLKLGVEGREVNILRGVDLEVSSGEVVAVVGPSGAGKTSMLMVLSGLEAATGGKITVCGEDLTSMNEDRLALFRRDNVGIVFQDFHLIPTMTALENVAMPMELSGRRDAMQQAKEGLEAVGLGHRLDHYPAQLSGGEQQRVALARAVASKPRLLLADEPTGNLDGDTGQKIMDLLFSLSKDLGSTLVLITHDPKLAEKCSRIVRMADGNLTELESMDA